MSEEGIVPGVFGRVLSGPADADHRDRLHHGARDHPRDHRRPRLPRRHDRDAAAGRVHRGQHLGASSCAGRRSTTSTSARRPFAPILAAIISRRPDRRQRGRGLPRAAGILLAIGVALWLARLRERAPDRRAHGRRALTSDRWRAPASAADEAGAEAEPEQGAEQGPEGRLDRLPRRPRDRARLDRARLLARRGDRLDRRRRRRPGPGGPARLLRPDVLHRGRVLLHEQGRPGLRHDLLLGDPRARALRRLDRRLGDLHDRRARDRLARRRLRLLHLRPLRPRSTCATRAPR